MREGDLAEVVESNEWPLGARRHHWVFVLSGCLVGLAHINIKTLQDAEDPLREIINLLSGLICSVCGSF